MKISNASQKMSGGGYGERTPAPSVLKKTQLKGHKESSWLADRGCKRRLKKNG